MKIRRVSIRSALALALALALAGRPGPLRAADEPFSFYGLQFGMTKGEAARHAPPEGSLAKTPWHGMIELELVYDREDLLMEIRAGWPRPESPFELAGLQRALKERFVVPVSARYPAIAVTMDEYGNRAAVRLVFLATNIREKNIDHHKNRYLKLLE